MTKKIESYRELLQKHGDSEHRSDIYYLDKENEFQKIAWGDYLDCVYDVASSVTDLIGEKRIIIGVVHAETFIWDIAGLAVKYSGNTLLGLNHHDSEESMSSLISKLGVELVICSHELADSMTRMNVPNLIILSFSESRINLCLRADKSYLFKQNSFQNAVEVISTSGTTGTPKIYYYNEQQIFMAANSISEFYQRELSTVRLTISWMPLANPFQRMLNLLALINNMTIYYINNPKQIIEYCKKVHVEFFASVPRFYQKIFEEMQYRLVAVPLLGSFFKYTIKKMCSRPLSIMDKISILGFHKIIHFIFIKIMGNKIQFILSGSAPLAPWLDVFYANMGFPIQQAYGMSENIMPITLSSPSTYKTGTVGKVLYPNDVKIIDGQIAVKSPCLFLNHPDIADEYFLTGDLGEFDKSGYLVHKGRDSDYFKTSTGRRIYPIPIEALLNKLYGVNFVCVLGQGYKLPCAILDTNPIFDETYPDKKSINEALTSLLQPLNTYEKPVVYLITRNKFTPQSGEITANMKLKRNTLLERYTSVFVSAMNRQSITSVEEYEVLYE
ncbi:AMP-binding protein [Legionella sp. CNM-4043-24]|uniref:AMP-binding protein n=1 Tax=Legionella sp. CNM-4043-24 TaxID=3421646 RepID=UPI00403A948E